MLTWNGSLLKAAYRSFVFAAALAGACALVSGVLGAGPAQAQSCSGDQGQAVPSDVAVTAVPIVVASTTSDYFVLYASFVVDGTNVEYPVLVTAGEDGTTTLAENVAALAPERYRVEKYSVDDPADVDGDCIDDVSELGSSADVNPVNPADRLDPALGSVVVRDHEAFEALAYSGPSGVSHLKFSILNMDTDRPSVYFQDSNRFQRHTDFFDAIGVSSRDTSHVLGLVIFDPDLIAPDGSRGLYRFRFTGSNHAGPFGLAERAYGLLAASMPLLNDDLAVWMRNATLAQSQAELAQFRASRLNLVFDDDVYRGVSFLALNPGEGYGLLRSLEPDDRPNTRDVVIYETLPNELPRVAGIISTVPQTPLSHVNLRALQDKVPNAYIAGVLDDDAVQDLIGSYVHYEVTDTGYSIRAATQAEVDQHYASSRPAQAQTPQRDLTVTSITALSEIGFEDWDAFGVKAANVAVLGTLGFAEGTAPDGFAVPFYFYDEFMKHNDLYEYVAEMLADPDFRSDSGTTHAELKKLRKKIKKADTPAWIVDALTAMHASFPEGTSLRYRSSTNNEDLPGFNGAGLYDSKTQHPDETVEDGISKSLKQVYASLWNFRAFVERDFHRVDHVAAAMGVLVHPNYSDEQVNGVAVSADPAYGTDGTYYVNSQIGEDLVTNPEAHSLPEEILLYPDGAHAVVSLSNQAPSGQLLMTDAQLTQLRRHLAEIHERFAQLYGVADGEQFAMEVEFKITSDNILSIKQARPWVFADAPGPAGETHSEADDVALTASFDSVPDTHRGRSFRVRVRFSENIDIALDVFKRHAVTVTGGTVTNAFRVNAREDVFEFVVAPDSQWDSVTVAVADNRRCTVPGSICTRGGIRLSTRLEHTVVGLIPLAPDRPSATVRSLDSVDLAWNEVLRARSYDVELWHNGQWTSLPADGIEITFDGATASLSGLPTGTAYSARVRARNTHGTSGWSPETPRTLPVLDSELTVGRFDDMSPPMHGFSIWAGRIGAMAPDSFVLDGTTYQINFLAHSRGGIWLGLDRSVPADFTLRVGEGAYRASESMIPGSTIGVGRYWWPSPTPEWLGDDSAEAFLSVHPQEETGNRRLAPVVGHFERFPDEHDGTGDVSFRIRLSDADAVTAEALRDHVLKVTGGVVASVEAVGSRGSNWIDYQIWQVSITPDAQHVLTVRIEAGLDCELPEAICAPDGRRLHNHMELTVPPLLHDNSSATGAPIVGGSAEVGDTVTADTSEIADADGLQDAVFSYQWIRSDGERDSLIEGATGPSYTVAEADVGWALKVTVSFFDDYRNAESLTSTPVLIEPPDALTAVAADGTVVLSWELPGDWRYGTSVFQILRRRPELGEPETLEYVPFLITTVTAFVDNDVEPGVLYEYRVKGVDPFGNSFEVFDPVQIRTPQANPNTNNPAVGAPIVGGSAEVGEMVSVDTSEIADADGLQDAVFSYQWIRTKGDLYTLIEGATGPSYTVAEADVGWALKVTVSFFDDDRNAESLTSTAVPVAPPDALTAAATPFTAEFVDSPTSHDGQSPFAVELNFSEQFSVSYLTLRDQAFTVTGGEVTGVRRLAPPGNDRWEITVRPDSDSDVVIVLPVTLDCSHPGALCAPDGRMLSTEVTLIVAGPADRSTGGGRS